MMQRHTARKCATAILAIVTVGLANACADTSVAPEGVEEIVSFTPPAGFDRVEGRMNFKFNNDDGGVLRIGDHSVWFPAKSICDPRTSTYGRDQWEKPCKLMKGTINITATLMRDDYNRPYVDFRPALRFAPDKEVMLFLRNSRAPQATKLFVEYCDNAGRCVDESMTDPTLKPFRVGRTSVIGRRLKHFSGYTIGYGEPCNGTLTEEPDGTWMCNDDGLTRRSGYMVASGLNGSVKTELVTEEKKGKKDEQ